MKENSNIILALLLSFAILFGFDYFFGHKKRPAEQQQPATTQQASSPTPQTSLISREQALANTAERVQIKSPTLRGSLSLKGARLDDLALIQYHETANPQSPEITLLSPQNTKTAYYSAFAWKSQNNALKMPDENSIWTADQKTLTPETPVTLKWDNGQGLLFEQKISLDKNYMFTVTQKVINKSNQAIVLAPIGKITRFNKPPTLGYFILHEGFVGVLDGKLQEAKYDDVEKATKIQHPQEIGWLGITDKYWLTALIPDQKQKISSSFRAAGKGEDIQFIAEYARENLTLSPGTTVEVSDRFFAGAKVLDILDQYEKNLGINHFDLAVDFGWFYFLTKPIFYALEFFNGLLGNFGLAILALTILIKLAFYPLANRSYLSMAKMKAVQPEIDRIKERYQHDRMKMNERMMELYKKQAINPVSGCLPMIIQIPVFFALYKVLFVTIEMRHAPFYGWIHDLSAPDPTSVFNLFGLMPWDPPSFLMIGILPLIMGGTMLLQQKMSPPPADPVQAKMFMLMPLFFTFLLAQFPAGLVLYWTWNNLLSILQQWLIIRQAGQPKKIRR